VLRAVVFDLWNTLAHQARGPNPMIETGRILGVRGRPGWKRRVEETIMRRRLPGIREALPLLEEAFGLDRDDATRRSVEKAWEEARPGVRLFPDVLPALERLRRGGLRLALLSNTQSFDLEFLEEGPLRGQLDLLHLSCDTGRLKPEPESYLGLLEALGLAPGEVLMVGDRLEDDVIGPRAAGMRAVLIRREGTGLSHREGSCAEPSIASLEELPGRLEEEAQSPAP
jgi:HAD superfamily hydrolase (TIGR01549 family)